MLYDVGVSGLHRLLDRRALLASARVLIVVAGMLVLQSSQLMPLHYRHGFHSRLADLNKLLRYFLGG